MKLIEIFGNKMWVYPEKKDGVSKSLLKDGIFERETTHIFQRKIKRGMTVIDVGAHIGYYSLIFAKLVCEEGRVYCFEPNSSNFGLLKKNVEINRYTNVIMEKVAAVDRDGINRLYLCDSNMACHAIFPIYEKSEEVRMIKLDSYFCDLNQDIDFVKLDVGGAELLAIMGMKKIIEGNRPEILLEFNTKWLREIGFEPIDVLNSLSSEGYSFFPGEPGGFEKQLKAEQIIKNTERLGKMGKEPRFNVLCRLE